jgi:hypothetical protein
VTTEVPVFVRSHFLAERDNLIKLGATDVITEEVEAGMEVLALVLAKARRAAQCDRRAGRGKRVPRRR